MQRSRSTKRVKTTSQARITPRASTSSRKISTSILSTSPATHSTRTNANISVKVSSRNTNTVVKSNNTAVNTQKRRVWTSPTSHNVSISPSMAPSIHSKRSIITSTSINKLASTNNSVILAPPTVKSKRTNYNFVEISGPTDTRYLADNEDWTPSKALIADNTYVHSAVILERPPIIIPKQPQWEVDWYLYRHAKMSESALVIPKDLAQGMYGKQGMNPEDFPEPLPTVTDDDKNNNRKSLYRALDEPLYLITKVVQDFDSTLPEEIWTFPTTEVREGETVRGAAERTLFYHVGDVSYYTLSNAPIVHHEQEPTDFIKKEYPSASKFKSFYMHSVYLGGNVELEPDGEVLDYAWVKQSELHEYFTTKYTEPILKLSGSSLYYLRPD